MHSIQLAFAVLALTAARSSAFTASFETRKASTSLLSLANFYNDFDNLDDDDDDDEDAYIDTERLGDWRAFRMNLSTTETPFDQTSTKERKSVSKENEAILRSQSEALAEEYENGMWAHETSTPEVGGLVLRMPLEVEIYRNTKHSLMGRKLRKNVKDNERIALWYRKAQIMCETEMKTIVGQTVNGQIDASKLAEDSNEFLQLYLDNQETWQEVSLVIKKNEITGAATSLVLNRPMAFKLTENLAQLVLNGAFSSKAKRTLKTDLPQFIKAFGQECAVYVGGPDEQDSPATLIHGFAELDGAVEISPGAKIYVGGMDAAVQGVIDGKYKPLDFRFFVGKHSFQENMLDLECLLGKYQPIASARALALKQCISLPKPLYHEVLEMAGGEMQMISQLELLKRDDLQIQFEIDEDEEGVIPDELDELTVYDDEDDDEEDEYII